jgi:uncharacterized membrane protein YagU involved in acid resistance
METKQSGFFWTALKSGLIVGVLDAIAASLNAYLASGFTPDRVFRFVASGAFGQSAYTGGSSMVWIGLLFHFIVAMGWTLLFFIAFPKLKPLQANKFLVGMAYGMFIWIMMNFVVIPLSAIGPRPFQLTGTLIMIMIHMTVIGIPISFFANNYYKVNNY